MLYKNSNRILFFLIIFCNLSILASGCTTISSLDEKYKRINFKEGIKRYEAKIIAKRELFDANEETHYRVMAPKVYHSSELDKAREKNESFLTYSNISQEDKLLYENCWFVIFKEKFFNIFGSYYLVVLDDSKGEIKLAESRCPFGDALGELFFKPLFNNITNSCACLAVLTSHYRSNNNQCPQTGEELIKFYEDSDKELNELNISLEDIDRIKKMKMISCDDKAIVWQSHEKNNAILNIEISNNEECACSVKFNTEYGISQFVDNIEKTLEKR